MALRKPFLLAMDQPRTHFLRHPVVLTDADRAETAKLVDKLDDTLLQDYLFDQYPTGLPDGVTSWAELLIRMTYS